MTPSSLRPSEVRFSLFTASPQQLAWQELFSDFFQTPAHSVTNKLQDVMSEVSATVGDTKFVLEATTTKIDFRFEPVLDLQSPTLATHIPVLNESWTVEKIYECAIRVINKIPASRLAVGERYLMQMESKMACYKELDKLIHGLNLDDNASDFTYRINRRKSISIAGHDVQINRIGQWSCLRVDLRAINNVTKLIELSNDLHAVCIDTDVNSAPEQFELVSSIGPEARCTLFKIIQEFSQDLASKGDSRS